MLLEGSFIPQFPIRSNPVKRALDRGTARNPVLCVSRSSSLFWWKNVDVQHKDHYQNIRHPLISVSSIPEHPELAFDRLQPSVEELPKGPKRAFGRFVARGARLDEEYWTAAWLRAEAHWESVSHMRQVDCYKRKYAEEEFNALKRRCAGRDGNSLKCICIIAVKKEDPNVRRTVLNSVVGTLDLSIKQFFQGETFPGECKNTSGIMVSHVDCDSHKYAYISNLCVSKFARRQGIATNMLYLATDVAASSGMKKLFVHVNAKNESARDLYKKNGFKIVEDAPSQSEDKRHLMWLEL